MTTRRNVDGTIDVQVVLTVKVDPDAWVKDMMDVYPDGASVYEVRRHIKAHVRDLVAESASGFRKVAAQGLYDRD